MQLSDNLNLKDKYVIGVSGGNDSMALLDMCRKEGYQVIVAHVNYHKRESAKRDEDIVLNYCRQYHIECFVYHQLEETKGNFQAFARVKRYQFYKELLDTYHYDHVLLAHQLDDHIETYLMQMKRKSIPEYYGIDRYAFICGCSIIRPLLDYTKDELVEYCEKNNVPYGIDESNLSDDYTRNQIRHSIIDHLTMKQKQDYKKEISIQNQKLKDKRTQIQNFLHIWNQSIDTLSTHPLMIDILSEWIYQKIHIRISNKMLKDICNSFKSDKSWEKNLNDQHKIIYSYHKLYIEPRNEVSYSYIIENIQNLKTEYFELKKEGMVIQGITLKEEDFPITIRSPKKDDCIQLRFGHKKVKRFFIDRKISLNLRRIWPIVENKDGKVIFVSEIGCDVEHFSNNPNIFVVK